MPKANKSCDMEERSQNFLRCFNLNWVLTYIHFQWKKAAMIKLYCNSISHLEKFNPLTTTYIEYRLLHPHNFEGWYLKSNSSFHFSISQGDIFELCIFLERLRRRKCIVLPKKSLYTNIPWLNWFHGSLLRWTNVIFFGKNLI